MYEYFKIFLAKSLAVIIETCNNLCSCIVGTLTTFYFIVQGIVSGENEWG